jgi:hypothetical protein
MASSTRLEAHHSISNYHGWRTSTFFSSFLLFVFVSRSNPQGSYSTRPCLKNGRSLFFPRLALIFHLNVCLYACAHVSAMQSHVPHFRPDGRIVQTPYPVPTQYPPSPATLSHNNNYYDDDDDCCCTWCEKQKKKQKSFFCSLTRLKRQKRMGEINQKCRCYLDDLLQVADVDGLGLDHFHDDAVHVREIVAASVVLLVRVFFFLLFARMFLLRRLRAGRAGTAHAAVSRVARVPQMMEIAVDGAASWSPAGRT